MLEENESNQVEGTTSSTVSPGKTAGIMSAISSVTSKVGAYIPSSDNKFNENIFVDAKIICANGGIEGQGPPLDSRFI